MADSAGSWQPKTKSTAGSVPGGPRLLPKKTWGAESSTADTFHSVLTHRHGKKAKGPSYLTTQPFHQDAVPTDEENKPPAQGPISEFSLIGDRASA